MARPVQYADKIGVWSMMASLMIFTVGSPSEWRRWALEFISGDRQGSRLWLELLMLRSFLTMGIQLFESPCGSLLLSSAVWQLSRLNCMIAALDTTMLALPGYSVLEKLDGNHCIHFTERTMVSLESLG